MRTDDQSVPPQTLPGAHGARLCIKYRSGAAKRRCERKVIYLAFGPSPPVTPVELELMQLHLDEMAKSERATAANSNRL